MLLQKALASISQRGTSAVAASSVFSNSRSARFGSSSASKSSDNDSFSALDANSVEMLEKYSRYQPSPLSMQHFLEFGRNGSPVHSFSFLKHEIAVRLANIMRELTLMPKELKETKGFKEVHAQYMASFKDLTAFEKEKPTEESMKAFTNAVSKIHDRHSDMVQTMASAVMEVNNKFTQGSDEKRTAKLPKFERNIQYFLDRLYTSRISTRMLINQHCLLFGEEANQGNGDKNKIVGAIEPNCSVLPVVEKAYENARFLCEQYYMNSPDIKIEAYDTTVQSPVNPDKDAVPAKIECVYVPSHLYHILFEVFKNSMRATIEHHGEESIHLPPINALIVKSKEDVTIRVSDRGGGIPRRLKNEVFRYLYTTAAVPVMTNSAEDVQSFQLGQASVPLAGYGYGLPLSRLYARYFNGDLELFSCEGYGTDAVLYLQSSSEKAKERLPIFHETGSKKIYEAQLAANDWTEVDTKSPFGKPKKDS